MRSFIKRNPDRKLSQRTQQWVNDLTMATVIEKGLNKNYRKRDDTSEAVRKRKARPRQRNFVIVRQQSSCSGLLSRSRTCLRVQTYEDVHSQRQANGAITLITRSFRTPHALLDSTMMNSSRSEEFPTSVLVIRLFAYLI